MLLMIRVNLIGSDKGQKRRSAGAGLVLPQVPNVGILLFVLGLVLEVAVIYSWHTSAAEAADRAQSRQALKRAELDILTDRGKSITALQEEVKKLQSTETIFEELFADKAGPVLALSYLAFILHPRNEAEAPAETLKALEAAGWRVAWDTTRAWFLTLRESAGEVTLVGQALAHEDVAEVVRRLESSPFFREVRLEFQLVKEDSRFDKAQFVEFTIKAAMIYLIKPVAPEPVVPAEPSAGAGSDAGADAQTDAGGGETDAGSGPSPVSPNATLAAPGSTRDAGAHAEVDVSPAADVDASDGFDAIPAAPDSAARAAAPTPGPAPGAKAVEDGPRPPAVGVSPPVAEQAAAPGADNVAAPGSDRAESSAPPPVASGAGAASDKPTAEKGE
ncbi:MAG: hypothetical protein EXR79_11490 [Myxococcales bacterium]|nr:hypothetical protein [Myxococcales bacterium]